MGNGGAHLPRLISRHLTIGGRAEPPRNSSPTTRSHLRALSTLNPLIGHITPSYDIQHCDTSSCTPMPFVAEHRHRDCRESFTVLLRTIELTLQPRPHPGPVHTHVPGRYLGNYKIQSSSQSLGFRTCMPGLWQLSVGARKWRCQLEMQLTGEQVRVGWEEDKWSVWRIRSE